MKSKWLALFRGINSGEQDNVPMPELERALAESGLGEVRSWERSGNVVFSSELSSNELEAHLKKVIAATFQVRPRVIVIEETAFQEIVAENPFVAEAEHDNVYVYFLRRSPLHPNFQQVERFKAPGEKWILTDLAFYLSTPGEFRSSQLAVRVERLLDIRCLSRTWAEVLEIQKLFQ